MAPWQTCDKRCWPGWRSARMQRGRLRGASRSRVEIDDSPSFAGFSVKFHGEIPIFITCSWWNPYFHHILMVQCLSSPHFDGSMPIFTTFLTVQCLFSSHVQGKILFSSHVHGSMPFFTTFWWFNAYSHHMVMVQCLFSSHVHGSMPILITCSWFNAYFHHILMLQCLFSPHFDGSMPILITCSWWYFHFPVLPPSMAQAWRLCREGSLQGPEGAADSVCGLFLMGKIMGSGWFMYAGLKMFNDG